MPASPVMTTTCRAPWDACSHAVGQHAQLDLPPDEGHRRSPAGRAGIATHGRGGSPAAPGARVGGAGPSRARYAASVSADGSMPSSVGQQAARPLVGPQRLGAVAGGVVRRHEGTVRGLVQGRPLRRLLRGGHRRGPVADRGGGLAGHEQRADHQVVESGPHLVGPGARVAGEERRPHERTGGAGLVEGSRRVGGQCGPGGGQPVGGHLDVHHHLDVGTEGELIAGLARGDGLAGLAEGPVQRGPGPADVRAERRRPRAGHRLGPDDAREAVARQRARALEDERRQHDAGWPVHGLVVVALPPGDCHVTGERYLQSHRPPRGRATSSAAPAAVCHPDECPGQGSVVTCQGAPVARVCAVFAVRVA